VARTIYLGSAPLTQAAHRGLEDRRVKLGCVMPGESPAIFGDALRRLAGAATYLYQDGVRYWYSTQPTVTKLAEDRAEQLKRDSDKVTHEIEQRLRADLRSKGDFNRVHRMPPSGQEVADDLDAGLVVLGIDHPYSKEPGNDAEVFAKGIFESHGNTPRRYRNALVFLAADKTRVQDLDEAARRYLAWESILADKNELNLDPQQVKQAETQRTQADHAVNARIPEAYQWLLVPSQSKPQDAIEWQAHKLPSQDGLAARASKKLRSDERLLTSFAGTELRRELDRWDFLWRGNHVAIKQLAEDFSSYPYLSRLKDPSVLAAAVRDGVNLLSWVQESFAYADSFDEATGRYRGLRTGALLHLSADSLNGLLVRPEAAQRQLEADDAATSNATSGGSRPEAPFRAPSAGPGATPQPGPAPAPIPTRFYGSVPLDPTRVGRDAARIADEVISHLSGLVGATVKVTLEIEAEIPSGAPDHVVRTVTENSRTLKFTSQGFEVE
jgi:hypothetical protein